jgi:transposase
MAVLLLAAKSTEEFPTTFPLLSQTVIETTTGRALGLTHCEACHQDLRPIGEETSERYEYVPAQLTVVEDVCKKYACACTVKTATKPPQPIEKSVAGASLLAQVIVAKTVDHLPLNRQEKIFERHGADISRKTMCGWMAQSAQALEPLYASMKAILFRSKVIGTDDTSVKVLDAKLPFARTGRMWPYYGDKDHPVIVYDYTATRERAGPEKFLEGYRGYLQADAYGGYDAFFKDPARGLTEVGCWAHALRYFHKALDSDQSRMGLALSLIAQLYRIENQARSLLCGERLELRPILDKLHGYLLEIEAEVLPKSPEGRAVRYTLKNWTALTRFCEDGDLAIDNNAVERAIRGIAVGRANWTFFGSDEGGKTSAVLRSLVASCQRVGVDPFSWFKDVLSRIMTHPINRITELLPHNWAPGPSLRHSLLTDLHRGNVEPGPVILGRLRITGARRGRSKGRPNNPSAYRCRSRGDIAPFPEATTWRSTT